MGDWNHSYDDMDADIDKHLNTMSGPELLQTIQEVLKDPNYVSGEYTKMISDILIRCKIRKLNPTISQLNAIKMHLRYNSRLWY